MIGRCSCAYSKMFSETCQCRLLRVINAVYVLHCGTHLHPYLLPASHCSAKHCSASVLRQTSRHIQMYIAHIYIPLVLTLTHLLCDAPYRLSYLMLLANSYSPSLGSQHAFGKTVPGAHPAAADSAPCHDQIVLAHRTSQDVPAGDAAATGLMSHLERSSVLFSSFHTAHKTIAMPTVAKRLPRRVCVAPPVTSPGLTGVPVAFVTTVSATGSGPARNDIVFARTQAEACCCAAQHAYAHSEHGRATRHSLLHLLSMETGRRHR